MAPALVAGDSCARTTWENATLSAAWLRRHHSGAPVLLITDPWQLPRAAHAFARQGLQVQPLAAEPQLSAPERNRLAFRETAATLLYALQGRM
ncbi:YdcF family protein [Synechococcus sp. CCY9202]|uniref:YdcF family protein n=1 Tax=Synechococcus sp. CCY9202 TaxID=174698 RepID=UPI002B213FC0|nr:YdcF family protein [Synechococcus sp. CCY9202]MEA5421763.1 YdcF family protein [Synechococcus sp. CCY9202]